MQHRTFGRRSFLALALAAAGCATPASGGDRAEIEALVLAERDRAYAAWTARDARILIPDDNTGTAAVTPDGRSIDAAALRADVQRRMDMTRSVEELSLEIREINIDGDRAIAVSHQRFLRTIALPDSAPRQRISTVTHRQEFERTPQGWRAAGPIQELDQTARWVDERAP